MLNWRNLEFALAFFFRKIIFTVRYEKPEIAGARHVHTRKIDFVEDAMTEREPHAAAVIERGTDSHFRA